MDIGEAKHKGTCFECGHQEYMARFCPNRIKTVTIWLMVYDINQNQIEELHSLIKIRDKVKIRTESKTNSASMMCFLQGPQ